MTTLIRPGLMFKAFPLPCPPSPATLVPSGLLEDIPNKNDVYIICKDGSVQSRHDPGRPIGWELIELDNGWMYRVNYDAKPLAVSFYGWADDIPDGHVTPPSSPRSIECPS